MQNNLPHQQQSSLYLTQHQIQRKLQQIQPQHDLFDFLLEQPQICQHSISCKINQQKIYQQSSSMSIQTINQLAKYHGCRCTKIQCLKLYCECFSNNRKCGSNCQCSSCHNTTLNQNQIYQAKMITNYRHPGHFKGVPAFIPTRRCTCKKSMCQKRYCQCYSAGLKCSEFCDCKDCQNGHPHSHDHPDYYLHFNDYSNMMQIQVPA